MEVTLYRKAYLPSVTLGELVAGSLRLFTVERPWILNSDGPGGVLGKSCIPDGEYLLLAHDSAKFPGTYAIVNEDLGVYYQARPKDQTWGRTAILIHVGNSASDVIGCIAVGIRYEQISGQHVVLDSHTAMTKLRQELGRLEQHKLIIRPTLGTQDIKLKGKELPT